MISRRERLVLEAAKRGLTEADPDLQRELESIVPPSTINTYSIFNADDLRALLVDEHNPILSSNQILPGREKLESLALALNRLAGFYRLMIDAMNAKVDFSEVKQAFDVLDNFFDARRSAMHDLASRSPSHCQVNRETQLTTAYDEFKTKVNDHIYILDIDIGASNLAKMREVDPRRRWSLLASVLARLFGDFFRMPNGKPAGVSNKGPAARFATALIPAIVGEEPSLDAVAQEIKRRARVSRNKDK